MKTSKPSELEAAQRYQRVVTLLAGLVLKSIAETAAKAAQPSGD